MARGRMISKTLSTSEKRAALHRVVPELAEFCQQLYPLLVAHADDFGRLQGDVFTVKHAIDPTSPRPLADFERGLKALDTVGLLSWYESGSRRYIQIEQFDQHQVGLHKRTTSSFPPPINGSGKFPEIPSELKGRELKRTEGNRTKDSSAPDGAKPAVLVFPTVGTGPKTWGLSEAQIAEWQELYPGIDVLAECRQALAWVKSNQPKTAKGMTKFLVNWFNRSVARGGSRGTVRPSSQASAPIEPVHYGSCSHDPKCGSAWECQGLKRAAERTAKV